MCKSGKLIFKYGTMGAGKSLLLIATAHNFQERSIPFIILKSAIDNRDGEDVIHSRALGNKECITLQLTDNIYNIISEYMKTCSEKDKLQWILIDEAQFLTKSQVDELGAIADDFGINVMCYGLRTDFKTELFPGSKRLFEISDTLEEIKSSCFCGKKTIFNARIDKDGNLLKEGNQIEIGGDDKYISLCRKCYFKKLFENKI